MLSASWLPPAGATEVEVVGLSSGKAVLQVDGGRPRTLSVGGSADGVRLLAVEESEAVVEVDGRRRRIRLGQQAYTATDPGAATITLTADSRGHFLATGSINGATTRFLVDTGATLVSLGAADARRANIRYELGQPGATQTANGIVRVWRVRLRTVKIGEVTLHDVEGAVHEQDMPFALLGMSFLNRMEMRRDGPTLTLRQRF
ncbi:MAG: retroviral-like aspartic protease family protein [Rhodocyclaceae bacterium]|nr:retroviral-like aspartic protease family protein [Rhodocyclaceae bacterium]